MERLRRLLGQLGETIGQPLPLACQDWAGTKAAYRFFSNERFGEDAILGGHFAATAARCAACDGPLLVVQDTTELVYKWGKPDSLGAIGRAQAGRDRGGKPRMYTQCGLLMHSGLVVTPEGLPLEDGNIHRAELELRVARVRVLLPIGKQKRYPALDLSILHARETTEPQGRARLDWKLATDLPVAGLDGAAEVLRWYACRWKIELFRKVLKSGCWAEAARLRTADRLAKLVAVLCIVAWRCFWTTMTARAAPDAPAEVALTLPEMAVLDRAVPSGPGPAPTRTLASCLGKVARLGGYLACTRDPPPGNAVMWRGWARLADIMLGVELAERRCGQLEVRPNAYASKAPGIGSHGLKPHLGPACKAAQPLVTTRLSGKPARTVAKPPATSIIEAK